MSVLYAVRHGQASFFKADYDQLSSTGLEQARLLGHYWVENQVSITEVYSGSLTRQLDTAKAVGESFREAGFPWPEVQVLEGLNEYHADQVMNFLKAELIEKHGSVRQLNEDFENAHGDKERYRSFHRLLEAVMKFYIAGDYESDGFETWQQFHNRVREAVDVIRSKESSGRKIAVFTSGGPIGVMVQTTLEAPEQQAGQLNWRVHNGSISQFTFSSNRISLDQFNSIPHLTTDDVRTYR
ncbi:MAG: histidine phosphatase family protein [Verrucomicrobia bacterium]|nr:histidine phosphatase family protein [Verrucomicrobiota bacterium]